MSAKDIREDASRYFLPIFLGSNSDSHKLAAKVFRKYGITSFVLDQKHSAWDFFDPCCKFVRLSASTSPLLICEQLIDIAKQNPYTLPMIIPCSDEYRALVDKHKELLEPIFILLDEDTLFSSSPLNVIF